MQLLSTLTKAKSNRKQDGTGETIATDELQQISGEAEAALYYALSQRMAEQHCRHDRYGYYRLLSFEPDPATDRLLIENTESLVRYHVSVTEQGGSGLEVTYHLSIRGEGASEDEEVVIDIDDIPLRMRDELIACIERGYCTLDVAGVRELGRTIRHYSSLTRNLPYLSMGSLHQELIGATLAAFTTIFSNGMNAHWSELHQEYALLVQFFLSYAKQPERELLSSIFDQQIHNIASQLAMAPLTEETLFFILDFLRLVRFWAIEPELRGLQEEIYPYLTGKKAWQGSESDLQALALALNFEL